MSHLLSHIPKLKKKYEKAIVIEEINKVLSESLNNYILDSKLKILGNPIPIPDEKIDWNADVLIFKFEVGLSPNLEVNLDFKNSLNYHKINIENKIIDERVDYLQQQYGELKDEKKISDTSELIFKFTSKEENIDKKMTLKLNQLKTKKIIDLVRKLNLNETFTFELKDFFKDQTQLISLSNKTIEEIKRSKINVEAKLLSIQKRVKASLKESFFKKIYPNKSIKTLTKFKEEIRKSIQSQYDQQTDQKFLNDVTKKLIEEVKFNLPRKFLIKWLQKGVKRKLLLKMQQKNLKNLKGV